MAPVGRNRYKHNFSIDHSESEQDVPDLLTDGLASCSLQEVSLGEGYLPERGGGGWKGEWGGRKARGEEGLGVRYLSGGYFTSAPGIRHGYP